jgi:hypothetical protein
MSDIARTPAGKFAPGVSGNPTGRPRGAAAIARDIMERSNNGKKLTDELYKLAIGPATSAPLKRIKLDAIRECLSRAVGKPLVLVDVDAGPDEAELVARLSDKQLEIILAAAGVIDVESDESDESDGG